MNSAVFFWLLLKASLFSTGGTGNLPILHQDLIDQGWATDRQFAEALAVGQISPGPSGLWVISLGYLIDGPRGSLLALIAIVIPPMLVLVVDRIHRKIGDHPAVQGFVHGLSLAVIGVLFVVLMGLLNSNGIGVWTVAIALASLGLGLTHKVPVWAILAGAGVVGVLVY